MEKDITIIPNLTQLEKQFEYVNSLIEQHRSSAIAKVNMEALQTNWEVGQYISQQLKSAHWGAKVVSDLADYLKRMNPRRKGYGKRNLYNMVSFYETYSSESFLGFIGNLHLDDLVQLPLSQLKAHGQNEIVQSVTAQSEGGAIVQSTPAQFELPFPAILAITSFTNHIEILNRCKSNEERVFYMLYSYRERLKSRELRRCIVSQTYSTLLDKDKMLSPQLLRDYPRSEYLLKDKAVVDFLGLPAKHNEHQLHKGLLEHMKEFILELGKDFLFVDSEYGVQVGGSTKRIDLLFYHRALQCLVAIELKAVDFRPEFVGKMDMYLEALDRDVKRDNENPSIGIILRPSADRSMVEYTLSRSLSPTMVAEYQRKLIPQEVMRKSLEEYCSFIKDNQ
jgi:predicted nuclease of restriction endonuclease-like (RecB) superfamily